MRVCVYVRACASLASLAYMSLLNNAFSMTKRNSFPLVFAIYLVKCQ